MICGQEAGVGEKAGAPGGTSEVQNGIKYHKEFPTISRGAGGAHAAAYLVHWS